MSLLRRIEKTLDRRLRGIWSAPQNEQGAREAVELYRDALDQVAARAQLGRRGEKLFPYNSITVELHAADQERKAVLEALFDAGQMLDDVRSTLVEERAAPPADLALNIHYVAESPVEMRVLCQKTDRAGHHAGTAPTTPQAQLIPARVVTLSGASSSPEFIIDRQRVNFGREFEVTDAMGRPVRRNDLYFPEALHEANSSVSRAHAHLRFDFASSEWRIFDDGSSLGTSLFRDGRRVEVPSHAGRGVTLRDNDEIYLGQVRLRFDLAQIQPKT